MRRAGLVRLLAATSIAPALSVRTQPVRAAVEPIQLVCVPTEDMTDLYYAVKTGMMARSGLDVTLVFASSGAAATAADVAGTYQIAKTSLLALFSAHLQDIPLIVIAPHILNEAENPQSLLQVAPDSPFKTGSDQNGKTIGVPSLGDFNTVATRAWVDKTGGDWRSLKFVEIPNSALEAAIAAHRIDAAILQTPQLDISLQTGTTKTLAYANAAISPRFILGAYVARRDWTVSDAAGLQRHHRAHVPGARDPRAGIPVRR